MLDTMIGGYTLLELFWYFMGYSFSGWLLEVIYAFKKERRFVNRGFLFGPFCPIYGFGVLSVLLLTSVCGFQAFEYGPGNLLVLFILVALLTTALEFVVGALLMLFFKQRWWDYSDRKMNIKGYICLQFTVCWGLGGSILYLMLDGLAWNRGLDLARPAFDYMTLAMFCYLVVDATKSVDLAIRLRTFVGELAEAARELRERIEAIPELDLDYWRIEAAIRRGRMNEAIEEFSDHLSQLGKDSRLKLRQAMTRYDGLLTGGRIKQFRHIVHAFPRIRDIRHAGILEVVKERINLPKARKRP